MLTFFFLPISKSQAFITKYKIPFTHSNVNVTVLVYSCHLRISQIRSNISLPGQLLQGQWQSIAPNEPAFNEMMTFLLIHKSPGVVYKNPKKLKPLDLCKTIFPLTLCRPRQPPVE